MKQQGKKSQRGIALLVSLFALILVTAIGLALMFSTNGETAINSGFRQSNLAYFAARAGAEEARDRIRYKFASNANGLADYLPDVPVGLVNAGPPIKPGVVYITNPLGSETVSPWDPTNIYFDDELCHEINAPSRIHNSPGTTDVPCPHTTQSIPTAACPGSSCWYQQKSAETLPGSPPITLAYKWTRINLKMNESSSPWCVLGVGSGCTPQSGNPASDQVCYNGKNEFVLADVNSPIDVPGQFEGTSLPAQLAMALTMFGGGSNGNGNSSGGSATAGFTSTSSSSSGNGNGTNATGNGTNANTGNGTTTTSTSTTGTSTTGTSTTGSSTSGTSTTGSSTTGTSTTGTSTSGSSTTGSLTTGSLTTGSLTTGSLTTGSLTTGSLTTGSLTTGSLTTGSSTTGSSTTGSSSTGSSTTGTSTTGSSSSSSSSSSTGGSAQCGTSAPPLPGTPVGIGPTPVTANSCADVDSQPVYMLTTLALAPTQSSTNRARRIIQYEVAKLAVPPVPAALTLIGPTPTASMPSSNPFNVIGTDGGTDTNGGTCNGGGGSGKPSIATVTDQGTSTETPTQLATDSRNYLINAIPSGRLGNYTGVDGCTPDVQNAENTTNSLFSTVQGLSGIVQNVQNAATQTAQSNPTYSPTGCTVSNCISSLGTDANPKVTVVDGDLTLSGITTGAGILLVTGTLTYTGNFSFDGVVMAIGAGKIVASGGGSGQFNGAVVVANIGNNSGCATNTQPCYSTNPVQANLLSQLGSPTLDWAGGGGNGIQYDTCALQLANSAPTYTVIARREITY